MSKPTIIILTGIIAASAFGGYLYFGRDRAPDLDFIVAKRGDLVQEVSVTGRVKASESVELAFENGGKISRAYADIGDKVLKGQLLVELENADLTAQLMQAEANTKAQRAKLDELKRGTRPEEIKVQEIKVSNAKISLEDAQKNLIDKLNDAYTKSDDAIRNKVDQFFNGPRSPNPQLTFAVSDPELKSDIELGRAGVERVLNEWNFSLDALNVESDLIFYTNEAKTSLSSIKTLLDDSSLAVNALTPSAGISQTTIDSYKADVSTARTNVNTAIANLSTAEGKLRTEESDLALAQEELTLKEAGSTAEQITAQEALWEEAIAKAGSIKAQLSKTNLRSPISGIVTRQDAKEGEIISANTIIVSVISEKQFKIETNLPEADFAKVRVGNAARVTLDAYGSDVLFNAEVAAIDPAETIIDGVATYKTTLKFNAPDGRIKSGMTANIDILAANRSDVIVIPQRAVISRDGDKLVKILNDNDEITEVKAKIGLRGSDGNIEIISGINEGDRVIIFIRE